MSDIWKNHEGYYDPTAGEAIRNLERGKNMDKAKPGEIWEVDGPKGTIQMLVLKQHDAYASGLRLYEDTTGETDIEVPAMTIMHADAGRPNYAYNTDMGRYIKTMKAADFDLVKKHVAEALGLEAPQKKEFEVQKMIEAVKAAPITVAPSDTEIEKLKTTAGIYQKLYEDLLERIL